MGTMVGYWEGSRSREFARILFPNFGLPSTDSGTKWILNTKDLLLVWPTLVVDDTNFNNSFFPDYKKKMLIYKILKIKIINEGNRNQWYFYYLARTIRIPQFLFPVLLLVFF